MTIWVLDTETKGTGAEMVPLETLLERRRSAPQNERISVIRRKPHSDPETATMTGTAPRSPEPRRFKVVDVLSREVLAEGAGARETVDALERVGSVVDVRIDVWDPAADDWRPLSAREKRALWAFRGRQSRPR